MFQFIEIYFLKLFGKEILIINFSNFIKGSGPPKKYSFSLKKN